MADGMRDDLRDFAIREIGCLCCWLAGVGFTPAEKHHQLSTGLHGNGCRLGEQATIGLCGWHHRGAAAVGSAVAPMWLERCGPSLADHPRAFRDHFGSDVELLAAQNELLAAWQRSNNWV